MELGGGGGETPEARVSKSTPGDLGTTALGNSYT